MKLDQPSLSSQVPQGPSTDNDSKKKLKLVRAGHSIASSLQQGNFEKALTKSIVSGIKLAEGNPFADTNSTPLQLASALRSMGIGVLGWTPETLFSTIDRMYFGLSADQVADELEKFQKTGVIQTQVPLLVRQKIYAIRITASSDTAHNEWHIFEKVGCAFNDRVAKFGIVEKLTPGECARTLAVMESIRPDTYADEVKAYIAASAHEEGILTLAPSKYLKIAKVQLLAMNRDSMGVSTPMDVIDRITKKLEELKTTHGKIEGEPDIITIQALKLMAIDLMGDEALR